MYSRLVARAAALTACIAQIQFLPFLLPLKAFQKLLSLGDYWHLPGDCFLSIYSYFFIFLRDGNTAGRRES